MKQKILIVDDDEDILSALSMLLKSEGLSAETASSPACALQMLRDREFDLVLMDLNYSNDTTSGEEGLVLINTIRQTDDLTPIVVMTGWGTIEVAVSTMKSGANDFVQKPWENDRLLAIVHNQIKLAKMQKRTQKLTEQNYLLLEEIHQDSNMVIESQTMRQVFGMLNQVAKSDVSVLLTGENGTGKSMFARHLHELSNRKGCAQVSVNMGAVTESLFESEMFGHIKGAFTDAKSTRIGRFELADEGTLFLDEIANTPYSQQAKLLRVLEDNQFEKVGSSKTQTVNIRLITATNSDLQSAVEHGTFRKDLLYRINTIEIEIPPLRKRQEDIIPLARMFLKSAAQKYSKSVLNISKEAEKALTTYLWPGNVRELSHVMERAQILCQSSTIQKVDLGLSYPPSDTLQLPSENTQSDTDLRSFEQIEAEAILGRLTHFDGDAAKAADSFGWSRSTFYRKLEKARE